MTIVKCNQTDTKTLTISAATHQEMANRKILHGQGNISEFIVGEAKLTQ